MRKFNIKVNGKSYEVEVEEVGKPAGGTQPVLQEVSAPIAPAVTPQAEAPAPKAETPKKEKAPASQPAAAPAAGGETVSSPMPGTILAVNVKPGDTVKNRDVLFVLEAMKMENEIMAPRDGKVAQVGVTKGSSVNTGDMLAVLE